MATRIVRPATAFPLSTARKRPRKINMNHLSYIRRLPCVICHRPSVDAAHVRYGSLGHGKPDTGGGEKPSDCWTVPLCSDHHTLGLQAQHRSNERHWWRQHGIDPLIVAALLFCVSGDVEAGELILADAKTLSPPA